METKKNSLAVPQAEAIDHLIEIIRAGISEFPGGSLLSLIIKTPVESRREEWFSSVENALVKLEDEITDFKIAALSKNEPFISTALSAAQIAQRTHVIEKRIALRNIVLNTAISPNIDDAKVSIFLNIVESLSAWHIKILDLFAGPIAWSARNSRKLLPNLSMASEALLLEEAFPELSGRRDFYDAIIRDLYAKELIKFDSAHTLLTSKEAMRPSLTSWGIELMKWINEPPELAVNKI